MTSPLKAYNDLLYTQKEYSFPKSSRFPLLKPNTPTDFTSNVQSITRSRSPSFGVGDRFKSVVSSKLSNAILATPPPNSYNIKTSFDGSSPHIKGNTITTSFKLQSSRIQNESVFIPGARTSWMYAGVPGPGTYKFAHKSVGSDSLTYSIKARTINPTGKSHLISRPWINCQTHVNTWSRHLLSFRGDGSYWEICAFDQQKLMQSNMVSNNKVWTDW